MKPNLATLVSKQHNKVPRCHHTCILQQWLLADNPTRAKIQPVTPVAITCAYTNASVVHKLTEALQLVTPIATITSILLA